MNQTHLPDGKQNSNQNFMAFERTVFAFERTALAYLRTALTFMIGGVTLIKLFDELWINYLGYLFIPIALHFIYLGILKFRELHKMLKKFK